MYNYGTTIDMNASSKRGYGHSNAHFEKHNSKVWVVANNWLYKHRPKVAIWPHKQDYYICTPPLKSSTINFMLRGQHSIESDKVETQIKLNSNNFKKTLKF